MSQTGMTIDDRKLQNAFKDLLKVCEKPEAPLKSMAKLIIYGIGQQFNTEGGHWNTPWPKTHEVYKKIRVWQGYRETPTLENTGDLKSKWLSVPIEGYRKGIIVGSALNYAEDMQEGISGTATFTKKSGGSQFSMPVNPQAREIIPVTNGFNQDEIDKMEKELRDAIEKEWNKNA